MRDGDRDEESRYNGTLPGLLWSAVEALLRPDFWNAHRMRLGALGTTEVRVGHYSLMAQHRCSMALTHHSSMRTCLYAVIRVGLSPRQVENCIWSLELLEPRTQGLPMGSGLRR